MNKRKILIIFVLLFLLITIIYNYPNKLQKEENISELNNSTLSFLLQNESGSDSYTLSSDKSWPSEDYVYNEEKSYCENGGELSYDISTNKVSVLTDKTDKCYVYFDKYTPTLATYIKSLYTSQGSNGIYYHDSSLPNSAGDNSYRYSGADPNNYVCFGSSASPCPDDNLYRIIGVFGNNVKLIKYDYATSALLGTTGDYKGTATPSASYYKGSQTTIATYYWNASTTNGGTANNKWNESRLNTINLNTNYVNNIGPTWSEKIEEVNWNIGGYTTYSATAKTLYDTEKTATYKAKIGLMTPSDYGYATIPDYWTTNLESYYGTDAKNNNWMYMGHYDWTITRVSVDSTLVCRVYDSGGVDYSDVDYDNGARPSFSLKSSITYAGGSGVKTDPIRIN